MPAEQLDGLCNTGGCENKIKARGLCSPCYHRARYHEGHPSSCHPDRPARSGNIDICNPCYRQLHYWKNPSKIADQKRARHHLQDKAKSALRQRRRTTKMHGLTVEAYRSMVEAQNHQCAICKTDRPASHGMFLIDHDHRTSKVRGLLCTTCNTALGHFDDDPNLIVAAIAYLNSVHLDIVKLGRPEDEVL